MNIIDIPELEFLKKPKTKLTLVLPGAGMMGCDITYLIVTAGIVDDMKEGLVFAYKAPRCRKMYNLTRRLLMGCAVLKGHHPKHERPLIFESETGCFELNGKGGRLIADDLGSINHITSWLCQHMLVHTLDRFKSFEAVVKNGKDVISTRSVTEEFLMALPPAVNLGNVQIEQPPVARVGLLNQGLKEKLLTAPADSTKPIVRIFSCTGASWLLCGMDRDGDTMWGYADIGHGTVEFGSISLKELETARVSQFRMPLERDRYFHGCAYTFEELTSMSALPSSLNKNTCNA